MKIEAALKRMAEDGFFVSVDGEDLRIRSDKSLSDEQRTFLRKHKPELVAHLSRKRQGEVYDLDRHAQEKQAGIVYWRFLLNGVEVDFASGATLTEAADLLGCGSDDLLEPMIEYSGQDDYTALDEDQLNRLLDRAVALEGLNLSRNRLIDLLSDDDIAIIRKGLMTLEDVQIFAIHADAFDKREQADIKPDIRTDTDPVTCGICIHFQPDTIGDGSGIGSCAAGAWKPGCGPSLYPRAKRLCDNFKQEQP